MQLYLNNLLMNPATKPGDTILPLKLGMIGEYGVGKSSFLIRFIDKVFPHHFSTFGIDFKVHKVIKEGKECKFMIWDPAGAERIRSLQPGFYKSLQMSIQIQLDRWMKEIEKYSSDNVAKILIGSKCDLPQVVSDEECKQYALQYGMTFYKTSAKENINVTEAMEFLMNMVFLQAKDTNADRIILKPNDPNENRDGRCCRF
ncbi:hypothetical protein FGO68_gene2121 [Halteria grandinella]|uniref:Uncharacterized protein n=1 Tax=Halteria grandinella TaxID=5974 RepID=A0A8J8NI50_HALGN|nr:hypothetical protein FGO68_gene2121 [Halteria grandinella]